MQDNLEKFIREHSEAFDAFDPPEHLWKKIDKKMSPVQAQKRPVYYAAAAIMLLIVGSFAWLMWPEGHPAATHAEAAAELIPDIKSAEVYYTSIVEGKRSELNRFSKTYPELCNDLDKELRSLDTMYGQLKTEYKHSNGNEAVLQALLENMQARVQLLNQQLEIIQNIKKDQDKSNHHFKSI